MTLLHDLAKELLKMFLADARLTAAILLLVGLIAAALAWTTLAPLWAGALLLVGSLAILLEAVFRQSR